MYRDFETKFTVPSTPGAPYRHDYSSTTLTVKFDKSVSTGGVTLDAYIVEYRELEFLGGDVMT